MFPSSACKGGGVVAVLYTVLPSLHDDKQLALPSVNVIKLSFDIDIAAE